MGFPILTSSTREHLERIDLVKMDIEGAEVFALADTERELLRAATQITVEFHDFCGILTTDQVNDLIVRMHLIGFYGVRFSNNNTDWLFVRKDAISATRPGDDVGEGMVTSRHPHIKHAWDCKKMTRRLVVVYNNIDQRSAIGKLAMWATQVALEADYEVIAVARDLDPALKARCPAPAASCAARRLRLSVGASSRYGQIGSRGRLL